MGVAPVGPGTRGGRARGAAARRIPGAAAGTEPTRPTEDAPGGMSTCCVETVTRGAPGAGMSALTRSLEDSALRGDGRPGGLAFEDVCGPRPEPERQRQRQHSGGSLPRRCPERRVLQVRGPLPPPRVPTPNVCFATAYQRYQRPSTNLVWAGNGDLLCVSACALRIALAQINRGQDEEGWLLVAQQALRC